MIGTWYIAIIITEKGNVMGTWSTADIITEVRGYGKLVLEKGFCWYLISRFFLCHSLLPIHNKVNEAFCLRLWSYSVLSIGISDCVLKLPGIWSHYHNEIFLIDLLINYVRTKRNQVWRMNCYDFKLQNHRMLDSSK